MVIIMENKNIYKCYDREYESKLDMICKEHFNEYGYNFDTNNRFKKEIDYGKINYQDCLKKLDK